MLSTNMPTGIQRWRTQHRRQTSTPAAFEAATVRPLPANPQTRRHTRNSMSLDLRGLDLESAHASQRSQCPGRAESGPIETPSFPQEDDTVSNTNLGQPSQLSMQVAQPHSQPQPGPQDTFLKSPVQTILSSPRTPRRTLRAQSPQQPPLSPSKPPTEQQLKALHEHIQSVYGSCGQVFINILPTPVVAPQKPTHLPSHEALSAISQLPSLMEITDINLEPTSSAMTFDFENPDVDMGYESSSYYTSDALSPSPMSSPYQKPIHSFLEGIEEHHEMMFSQPLSLFQESQTSTSADGLPISIESFQQSAIFNDLEVDASLEYTGIAPEEVQRYISEQDPVTQKWTCMFQDCGKVFGRRENIRSHVQTHLGDRQFKCNGCGKCFVRQHDLKRHAKIHSGNKPYKCPCGAGFARQDALTRHRQRGMCVGGFADAVRRQAKRGRPKKHRPDMEQRVEKANRTRRAIVSAPSSVSASSPGSDARSPSPFEGYEAAQSEVLPQLLSDTQSFNDSLNQSTDPFSFETSTTSFEDSTHLVNTNFAASSSYEGDITSLNIFQQLSQRSQTPPMSPADERPDSTGSPEATNAPTQQISLKGASTPSRSSVQSNPFSTPPTSPVEPKDDLDELFSTLPENSFSQFDLEMKAMDEFTSMGSSSYDLLDFEV